MRRMRLFDFVYEIKEGLRFSLQAIYANALRSMLTTLGIVIGIVSVTLMGTAIEGLSRAFHQNIAKIGADVLYVQKWPWFGGDEWWKYRNRRELKLKEYRAIDRQATLIKCATPVVRTRIGTKYLERYAEAIPILGVNEKYADVTGVLVETGRFFTEMEAEGGRPVCVMGVEVADKLFPMESPLGKIVKIGPCNFRVIGVMERQGSLLGLESLDNWIAIPIRAFFRRYGAQRGIQIFVKAADPKQIEDTKEELRGILRKSRRVPPTVEDDFALNQQELFLKKFNALGALVAAVGLFITALSLFVGAIGIMNIMFVSVTERTREIGIRKAIGAKRRTILLQFLCEAASLSLIGGLIGVGIAYLLSLLINQVLPTAMPLRVVAVALTISILVGVCSGLLPAIRASKLQPVETLRYE